MSGGSSPNLPALDGLLAQSLRNGTRVRMHLRVPDGDPRPARVVEGVVLEVSNGRDGRARLRVGIPTGSGDPVEVRVLLDGIDRVEPAVEETPAVSPSQPGFEVKPPTPRRATLAFGALDPHDSGVRLSREPPPPKSSTGSDPLVRGQRGRR